MSAVFEGHTRQELDALLNTRERVPDHKAFTDRFETRSAVTRSRAAAQLDVAYGAHPRERLDVFLPARVSAPAVNVFFHGGYWRASDKERYAFLAETFLALGAACITVEYALVPDVSLDQLIAQCRRAVAYVHHHGTEIGVDPARIYLSGHSAGGQIVGMLMADGWHREYGLDPIVIRGGCGISGLYDMEPIRLSYLNDTLALDPETARRNSVYRLDPAGEAPLILAVGSLEGEEFLRQGKVMEMSWRDRIPITPLILDGLNHYSAVEALSDPDSALASAVQRQLEL